MGVQICDYYTNNGIYTSKGFATEFVSKFQGIKHSGVGGHPHSVVADIAIKLNVCTAHTMMIYAVLHWPDHNHQDIWPLFIIQAVLLQNDIHIQSFYITPHEVWSCSKYLFSALVNAHPWGQPFYVLQPWPQDGLKISK